MAADVGGEDGHTAGHRLQRHDAEGLVDRRAQHQVGAAEQGGHVLGIDRAEQPDPVGDAGASGERGQALRLGVGVEAAGGRAARDEEFGVRDLGQGADGLVVALAGHEPTAGEQAVPLPSGGSAAGVGGGVEVFRVDTAGDHGHLPGRYAHVTEFDDLVGAGGQDPFAGAAQLPFDADALVRAGVPHALVAPLDGAEGVEGLHEGDAVRPGADLGGHAGHPEVGVHHVGRLPGPGAGQVCAEGGHVREQFVLGHDSGRSGRHVLDDRAAGQRDPVGQTGGVPAGVDRDVVAALGQLLGEAGHVDVLSTGVDAAERGEGARVLGHHGDPHRVTSFSSRSQSSRKRDSP